MDSTEVGHDNLNFKEQNETQAEETTHDTNSCLDRDNFRKNMPVHMKNISTTCESCNDVIANGRPAGVRSCPDCKRKWAKAR